MPMRPNPNHNPRQNKLPKALSYFSYFMVIIYAALGACLLFTDLILAEMPRLQRGLLGGVLLLYALYRGYTIYSRSKPSRYDD